MQKENKNVVVKTSCHSRGMLSGIYDVQSRYTKQGFTLIELLVVVLIIGILAAVAVPQYKKAVYKSHYAKLKTLAASIVQAQEVYYLANGHYATKFEDLDIEMPGGKTADSTDNQYSYDWGYCSLGHIDDVLDQVNCSNTNIHMVYQHRTIHSNQNPSRRVCVAGGTQDVNAVTSQICKAETGDPHPEISALYTTVMFVYQ